MRVVAMHITEIDIGWLPPLEDYSLICDEQVNLFIGPNASGKSTILRALKMMHSLAIGGAVPYQSIGEAGRIT